MLADILRFINYEPPSVKHQINGCPPNDNNCPMGHTCNIVRSRTCPNGEFILNKSQVSELDCQLAMCYAENLEIQDNRNKIHRTVGINIQARAFEKKKWPFGINLGS